MKKIFLLIVLIACTGCATHGLKPSVLTSRDQMFTIRKGTTFEATQTEKDKPIKFVADEDLSVLYKGNLLDLEKEANKKAIAGARTAKKNGIILGSIGSILAIISGFVGKSLVNSVKRNK